MPSRIATIVAIINHIGSSCDLAHSSYINVRIILTGIHMLIAFTPLYDVVVVGEQHDPRTEACYRSIAGDLSPQAVVTPPDRAGPSAELVSLAPALQGKQASGDGPVANGSSFGHELSIRPVPLVLGAAVSILAG